MIKAVIVEDELNNREVLQQMLERYCEEVEVVGLAVNVSSGIEKIKELSPDIVFLDIEMPGGTGFDVLNAFDLPKFKIIFVTGYDHFAIKAIRYSALDYLLKPVDPEELKNAVEKAKSLNPIYHERIDFLKSQIEVSTEEVDRIIISDHKHHKVVEIRDIIFVEAKRTFVVFYVEGNKKYAASNSMGFYEELLPSSNFFRIHKSHIINRHKVEKVDVGRGGNVHLKGGVSLPVAIRRKPAFTKFLEQAD